MDFGQGFNANCCFGELFRVICGRIKYTDFVSVNVQLFLVEFSYTPAQIRKLALKNHKIALSFFKEERP